MHIYATYEGTDINQTIRSTAHIFDKHHRKKYGCHIPKIAHMDHILNGHTDPTFWHI